MVDHLFLAGGLSTDYWIKVSPLGALPEPPTLGLLKGEIARRWPMTSLLDILKEADLRVGFTHAFTSVASREALDPATLQRRLLLCLYGLGTNTGLKRIAAVGLAGPCPNNITLL